MATGAEALVSALDRVGIPVVFGVVDVDNLALAAEFRRRGTRFVTMPTVGQAIQAADGFARRTGRVGCVLGGTARPSLGLRPEVAEAVAGEVPVLLLEMARTPAKLPGPPRPRSAEPPVPEPVIEQFDLSVGVDLIGALRSILDTVNDSPRGPVIIRLAPGFLDGAAAPEPEDDTNDTTHAPAQPKSVEHVQLRRAGNLVDDSQHVLVWAGGGALRAQAGGAIAELAEKVGAPVITTEQGAGLLPARHPCLVGLPPHLPEVGALWDRADLVIAIGTDFDEQSTQGLSLPEPASLIAINIDAVAAGRHYRPDVLLRGDARTLTKALSDTVSYRGGTAVVRSRLQEMREQARKVLRETDPTEMTFLDSLSKALPDRTTVVTDPCAAGRWLSAFHEWTLPRTLLTPTTLDAIGYALPAAIGGAMSATKEPILAIIGDQGLLPGLGALTVMAREKPALTVMVTDDGGVGALRPRLAARGLDPGMFDQTAPDFAALARTFGIRADTIDSVGEELATALRAHVAAPDPTVLVVRTELAQPPTDVSRWYRRPPDR